MENTFSYIKCLVLISSKPSNNFFYRSRYNAILELQLHFFNVRHNDYAMALKQEGGVLIMNYLVFEGWELGQFPPLKNVRDFYYLLKVFLCDGFAFGQKVTKEMLKRV